MQYISLRSGPTQSRPPWRGAGAAQVRRRHLTATPHVALQADHPDQDVQPPWTVQLVTLIDAPEDGEFNFNTYF